jgi:hypothetical protein
VCCVGHCGLGWVGLGWVGLGWVGLGWVGLGWVGLVVVGWVIVPPDGSAPTRFKCVGLRNPVLNIALMVGVTDIPDWCYVETYGTEISSSYVCYISSLRD